MRSLVTPQAPLSMLQRRMLTPTANPVTVVFAAVALVKLAAPCTTVHEPVATPVGAFAAMVTVEEAPHTLWSGPASAACAVPSATTTSEVLLETGFGHTPLFTVQVNE
ncbi:MAG: hypothetical protein BWY79_02195 [Actinobacteria bacterium ADurb.Bin444]|nr:MAG: hypothetical protein BWY79_02195 [Actinobacteria bacterium ADurb.Bin444]